MMPREVAPDGRRGGATVALLLLLLLLLVCYAHTLSTSDKRSEMSPVPFVMGSRYGRSSPARSLSPRNDRFFMGGRYGKRSQPPSPLEVPSRGALVCRFTGVYPLYRCVPRLKQDHFDKRKAAGDHV